MKLECDTKWLCRSSPNLSRFNQKPTDPYDWALTEKDTETTQATQLAAELNGNLTRH